ncbi:MAG: hypothetical protein HY308_15835 [Gammaproteobacteria bacterium]|nr:hypothetical protein [Gammaproteobacteria bacterium]
MTERNPYMPPTAVVEDQQQTLSDGTFIPGGRGRPAGNGWQWIATSWTLFKRQPGMWILGIVLSYGALFLTSLIPFVNFVMGAVWPIFTAGFVAMAHAAARGERFGLSDLFAGFRHRAGELFLVGLIYLAMAAIVVIVFVVIYGTVWFGIVTGKTPDPAVIATMGLAFLVYILIMMAIGMAISFAPALVYLHDVSPLSAIKMSITASMKNMLPGLVSSLIFIPILLLSMIPLGLGLFVTVPLAIITFYAAYRDIFLETAPA